MAPLPPPPIFEEKDKKKKDRKDAAKKGKAAKPADDKLMQCLAKGAVAAAEAKQLETIARGRAKAATIDARGTADALKISAQADAEAEVTRAEGSKQAAELLNEQEVAVKGAGWRISSTLVLSAPLDEQWQAGSWVSNRGGQFAQAVAYRAAMTEAQRQRFDALPYGVKSNC